MKKLLQFAALLCVLSLLFSFGLSCLEQGRQREDRRLLEEALRRTAVACYAAEGFYPPDVAYMQLHYGLRFDENRFAVRYEVFASNLMPDITVLER